MTPLVLHSCTPKMQTTITVPGDKSISHRLLFLASMASGESRIHHLLQSEDIQATSNALTAFGVSIAQSEDVTIVTSNGLPWQTPEAPIDCGNSGTTARLLMGAMAGQPLTVTLAGDHSLSKRPMRRIVDLLAPFNGLKLLTDHDGLPMTLQGQPLTSGAEVVLPTASAQMKTAALLTAMRANGRSKIIQCGNSRDHTERLFDTLGVAYQSEGHTLVISGPQSIKPFELTVPGDLSAAAFWIGLAALIEDSRLIIDKISLNPSRMGFVTALKRMGAEISWQLHDNPECGQEPMGTLLVRGGRPLTAIQVFPEEIPYLIDELPLLAVIASFAKGRTVITGAKELKYKESNRITATVDNLRGVGVQAEALADGMQINGGQAWQAATIETMHDHRIAMAFTIGGIASQTTLTIDDFSVVNTSYPEFLSTAHTLGCQFSLASESLS